MMVAGLLTISSYNQ